MHVAQDGDANLGMPGRASTRGGREQATVHTAQIGPNSKLSHDEAAAHFALWAIAKAPLLISTNLRQALHGVHVWQFRHRLLRQHSLQAAQLEACSRAARGHMLPGCPAVQPSRRRLSDAAYALAAFSCAERCGMGRRPADTASPLCHHVFKRRVDTIALADHADQEVERSKLDTASLRILTAPEVIAVNQDPLGVAGDLVWKQGPSEVRA